MRQHLAGIMPRVWQDKHHLASLLLFPLSLVYGLVMRIRRWMYRAGWMNSQRVGAPVIVVGNITVGGTGKSPLVIWLAEYLCETGYKPGIISRGYGGSAPQWPVDVTLAESPETVGDEAVMLYRRSGVPVAVSPRRADAAGLLVQDHAVDIIISDDGLQHLALERDLEIVLIDAAREFGNQRLLPSGPLREPLSAISPAAVRVYSGESTDHEYSVSTRPLRFVSLADAGAWLQPDAFDGQAVNAVAGIGFPEKFFATLKALGIRPVAHAFADHHVFSERDLEFDTALPLLMTEKDAVKCAGLVTDNAWYLEITSQPNPAFVQRLEHEIKFFKI